MPHGVAVLEPELGVVAALFGLRAPRADPPIGAEAPDEMPDAQPVGADGALADELGQFGQNFADREERRRQNDVGREGLRCWVAFCRGGCRS